VNYIRIGMLIGLVLWFPCPWYLVAVGGLLPLPVIVLYGLGGGAMLVFSLIHLAVYASLFVYLARRVRRPVTGGIVLAALLASSFLPIYGSGENLALGGKLNRNAYQAYSEAFAGTFGGK
jgi:hypothetical protein